MKKNQTWKLKFKDGTFIYDYGKKEEILDHITARQFIELVSVEIVNRGNDKVNHKPITKEQLM